MMRIRSTKPEFWRSKTIAEFAWDVRLVLKGLESYVDDNGVGKDDLELIAGDVFPRDLSRSPRDTLARLSEAISILKQGGVIARYEINGEHLLYIDRWNSIQRIDRPSKGRFPRPDGTTEYSEEVSRESYASPPETLAPVTGEQGNRGTGDKKTCATKLRDTTPHDRFEEFWETYPLHRGKANAVKAFTKALKRANPDDIIAGAYRYATDPNRQDGYTKYAEGWLNGDGWLDEPLPARNGNGTHAPSKLRAYATLAAEVRANEQTQLDNPQKAIT